MQDSIRIRACQRKRLLEEFRTEQDAKVKLRLHIVLLLADGQPWSLIAAVLYCSTATIARWKTRYEESGMEGLKDQRGRLGKYSRLAAVVIEWVLDHTPRDFGFFRSRWTCQVVVILLAESYQAFVSQETVRRWLKTNQLVWRRPRPVLGPTDPKRKEKLKALRKLLAELPADQTAVFEDEVDINLNPKIGSMWMSKGQQAEVQTPGTNRKRYLAGSLHWRTGALIKTEGDRRNGQLFEEHLDDLRYALRRYKTIPVICDNANFHNSQRIRVYLQQHGRRIQIHFLPTYAPETNPIERIWWHLHENITRNHRCQDIEELMDQVFDWLESRTWYNIETSDYNIKAAA